MTDPHRAYREHMRFCVTCAASCGLADYCPTGRVLYYDAFAQDGLESYDDPTEIRGVLDDGGEIRSGPSIVWLPCVEGLVDQGDWDRFWDEIADAVGQGMREREARLLESMWQRPAHGEEAA